MTFVSKTALAVVLGMGATMAITANPADAQRKKKEEAPAVQVNDAFRAAAVEGETAIKAGQVAEAQQKLAVAEAAATNDLERFYAANLKLQIGQALREQASRSQNQQGVLAGEKVMGEALDVMLSNPNMAQAQRPLATYNRALIAQNAKQYDVALQNYQRAKELGHNDPNLDLNIAQIQVVRSNPDGMAAATEQAIATSKAAGQKAPEAWYKRVIQQHVSARKPAEAADWMRRMLAEYPTSENWRQSLANYTNLAQQTGGDTMNNSVRLDVLRLMRQTGALAGPSDYRLYADIASRAGLPYETVAIIDEGRANGTLQASQAEFNTLKSQAQAAIRTEGSLAASESRSRSSGNGRVAAGTANAFLANGDTNKAIEFFKLAQEKGGVDADEVNTRLGIAYARAGQTAEAKQAFAAVRSGPRGEVAKFWTLMLDTPRATPSAPAIAGSTGAN